MAAPTPEQIKQLLDLHNSPAVRSERLQRSYGLDDTRSWIDPNGHRLSDRVWLARRDTRSKIDDVLRHAVAEGTDALVVADTLEAYLRPSLRPIRDSLGNIVEGQARGIVTSMPNVRQVLGSKRPFAGSHSARRLARTEISRAHGQATIWAAERTPFATGVEWSISGRHSTADPCDMNASRDAHDLGPGVYPVDDVPSYPEHPACICTLSTVTVDDVDAVIADLKRQYGLSGTEGED